MPTLIVDERNRLCRFHKKRAQAPEVTRCMVVQVNIRLRPVSEYTAQQITNNCDAFAVPTFLDDCTLHLEERRTT